MTQPPPPPQNLEAEKCFLGSCLLDPNLIDDYPDAGEQFFGAANADVWTALQALRSRRTPIELIPLRDELKRTSALESVGGVPALSELWSCVSSSGSVAYYAEQMQRAYRLRRIIKDATGSFWDHKAWRPEVVNGAITHWVSMDTMNDGHLFGAGSPQRKCPQGRPGDRLWVKETCIISHPNWADRDLDLYNVKDYDGNGRICQYIATSPDTSTPVKDYKLKVSPSMFMPRWASRISLEVVSVRVERLNEISEADAVAEGIPAFPSSPSNIPAMQYQSLWESINGPGSWEKNPWVWVVEFRLLPTNTTEE